MKTVLLRIKSVTLATEQYQRTLQEICDTKPALLCLKVECPQMVLNASLLAQLKVVKKDASIKLHVILNF